MARKSELFLSRLCLLITILVLMPYVKVSGQNELDVVKNNWIHYSDVQNSLYHYLAEDRKSVV